jgi:tRNA modification GTPase
MGSPGEALLLEETIIAISTPPGFGGLGVVRLSGTRALAVALEVFRPKGRSRRPFPIRKPVMGSLADGENGESFEEGLLTYFKAPHSYTREDVVELSCHGSPVILEEIVRLGVRAGARRAHPGEFTLRAWANGRIDILEAEAVDDLVRAASLFQAKVSFRQLSGTLSGRIRSVRKRLVRLSAEIEAGIEFPEEAMETARRRGLRTLALAETEVRNLVESYQAGRAMSEGLTIAIAGKTNVGKSTLFNALLGEKRAIVTPYPGTTRDYLMETMVLGDAVFRLVDMAGLGKPLHPAEGAGIRASRRIVREADGLLVVLDGSRKAGPEDAALLEKIGGRKAVIVVNKSDLKRKLDVSGIGARAEGAPVVEVSALRRMGLERLKEEMRRKYVQSSDFPEEIILHARQRDILKEIKGFLREAGRRLEDGRSDELAAEEIRKALAEIGRLTGEVRPEEVMDDIFSRFCVGK